MDLADRFRQVRATSQSLAAPLSAEDCQIQSMPDASPVKWHLGHTSWFFETLILEGPGYAPFEPAYRVLFNSYYNSVGEQYDRPQRGLLTRPSLDEVMAYRAHVDRHVLRLLDAGHEPARDAVLELGLHHEQQHQELLLTDVKHALSANPFRPAYRDGIAPEPAAAGAAPLTWFEHEAGLHEIGATEAGFAFDNERPRHPVHVADFALASRPVTNGEFIAFVEAGGYQQAEHWLADGWATVCAESWEAPLYWRREAEGYTTLTFDGRRAVDPAAPVSHLSAYEADAYARFAGARLPTEAEWEIAAAKAPAGGNFVESGRLEPQPSPAATTAPAAMFGDVWEWTSSAYTPYPGFKPLAGSLAEYNGKFMSSQLVLRGGSCATAASHIRTTYRNFFYPHQRWQFSGLRLARDLAA